MSCFRYRDSSIFFWVSRSSFTSNLQDVEAQESLQDVEAQESIQEEDHLDAEQQNA